MSNKRINKAYIRYDGNGRVIPGALILNRFKPTGGGKWHEIPAYECCNPSPQPILPLRLLFSNILEVGGIVGDVTDVANWNTYFDLPAYGSAFTSVEVIGDEVKLYGGSSIIIKQMLFDQADLLGTYLLEVDDQAGSIVEVEYDGFGYDNYNGCQNTTLLNLPNLTIAGDYAFAAFGFAAASITELNLPSLTSAGFGCFSNFGGGVTSLNLPAATVIGSYAFTNCTSLTNIYLPSCLNLGATVGDDVVFGAVTGNTITLTVPTALMTADAGNPDGDIAYLQANNTVTVVTV